MIAQVARLAGQEVAGRLRSFPRDADSGFWRPFSLLRRPAAPLGDGTIAGEKTVNENRDRLLAVDVSRVETAIGAVRDAVKAENIEAIRRTAEELQKASHAIAEQLYTQAQNDKTQASGSGPQASGTQDDSVMDGEVVA